MKGLSIVIPSRNASNLSACISAIWRHEPDRAGLRIIVVDDGLHRAAILPSGQPYNAPGTPRTPARAIEIIDGVNPFIFARNVNLGILAAGRDDTLVLNDDTILETPFGFSSLRDQWYRHPEFGVIGPVIRDCGNIVQRPGLSFMYSDREDLLAAVLAGHMPLAAGPALRESPRMVIFACAFIPRQVIDRVGLLDESFGINAGGLEDAEGAQGYGCEDGDYCHRVRAIGLKIGVFETVRVSHGAAVTGLPHTFRINYDAARYAEDSRLHERLFEKKWGEKP